MDIHIEGLVKTYPSEGRTVKALDGIDLHIPANQIFTLLGPSGCGKTTLLRCIVGLETPDDGEIRIGDQVVWSRARRVSVPPEKRGLGMVFQTYAIWPHMTVFDNVAYPLQVRRAPPSATRSGRPCGSCSSKAWRTAPPPACRAASSSASPWRAPWWPSPR